MGYALNPETGKLELITAVTGTIHSVCGCHIRYNDTNAEHRAVRLANAGAVTCAVHGVQRVQGGAYSGPPELLWPDPVERRQALADIARDHEEWWAADVTDLHLDDGSCCQ